MSKKHKIKKRKVKSIQLPDGYEPLYPEYYDQDVEKKTPWYKKRPTKKQVLVVLSVAGAFVAGAILAGKYENQKNSKKQDAHDAYINGLPETIDYFRDDPDGFKDFMNETSESVKPIARHIYDQYVSYDTVTEDYDKAMVDNEDLRADNKWLEQRLDEAENDDDYYD